MSWLYTIFVAGLLFSNGSDLKLPLLDDAVPEVLARPAGDVVEKLSQTYPLGPTGRVSVSNVNGPINLEPWDRNEVLVEATKIADCQESLDMISIDVTAKRDYLRIESKIKSWETPGVAAPARNRKIEVHFRLKIPRNAVLNEIEAVNGNVTAFDFANSTKISVVNGNVVGRNLRGTSKLSTVNGEVKSVFDDLNNVTSVDLETVNGRVKVEIPSNANATIRADSLNGEITNDLGLPVKKGKHVGRDLHGRIGTGETALLLSSVNGGLYIGRKKDGNQLNDVTNLLNSSDGELDDLEVSGNLEARQAEAVRHSVDRSNRVVDRNAKAAQKDLEKAHIQTEKMNKDLSEIKIKLDEKEFKNIIAEGLKKAGTAVEFGDAIWSSTPVSVEQRSATFEIKGTPKINVDAAMCSIRVRGWDRPTVKYVLTEERFARDKPLKVTQNATDNAVNIKVANSANMVGELWGSDNRFRIEVYVPRKSDIEVTTEKNIRVEGVAGRIELSGTNGALSVRDSEGTLKINSDDGLIRIIGFRGDLEMTTSDADVYLEGEFAKISASASDANVTLTMPSTGNASISTNTAIQSEGLNIVREGDRTWRLGSGGPKYQFEFAEGQLVVRNQARIDAN
jgi:hypothetical protein